MCTLDWNIAAAWVQAVGSIAAIIAAILIARHQHQQNMALVEAERLRQREESSRLVNERKDAIRQTTQAFRGLFDDLLPGITQGLAEGASPALNLALTDIQRTVNTTIDALASIKDTVSVEPHGALAYVRVIDLLREAGRMGAEGPQTLNTLHANATDWITQYEQALRHV